MNRVHSLTHAVESARRYKKYFFWSLESFLIFSSISVLRWCFLTDHLTAIDIVISWMLAVQIVGAVIGMFFFRSLWKQNEKQLE